MAALPAVGLETDRRWVLRVRADSYLRFDTCVYSLDSGLAGRPVDRANRPCLSRRDVRGFRHQRLERILHAARQHDHRAAGVGRQAA